MSRKKQLPMGVDVRAILESPVGKINAGRSICAYEAGMRMDAQRGGNGNMRSAGRFLRELLRYGVLEIPHPEDDHQYVVYVPKDWDSEEWHWMFNQHGLPPWPGEHDGLIPEERWEKNYGSRPRPKRRARRSQ